MRTAVLFYFGILLLTKKESLVAGDWQNFIRGVSRPMETMDNRKKDDRRNPGIRALQTKSAKGMNPSIDVGLSAKGGRSAKGTDAPSITMAPSKAGKGATKRSGKGSKGEVPSAMPSISSIPSAEPSVMPSTNPTLSAMPSVEPSSEPSSNPTLSAMPSVEPSAMPSSMPSVSSMPTRYGKGSKGDIAIKTTKGESKTSKGEYKSSKGSLTFNSLLEELEADVALLDAFVMQEEEELAVEEDETQS